jgi:predicted CopG family antitoxin
MSYAQELKDVRKNFVFKADVAKHLEEIAKKEQKSMTAVIEELIEKKYQEISKEEKLKAFYSLDTFPGAFVGKSIQTIKAEMDV